MFRTICLVILFALLITAFGCSGSTSVLPDQPTANPPNEIPSLPVWVSDYDQSGNAYGGSGLLGLFTVHADPSTLQGELTSLRTNSSADVLEIVDITNFLQLAPCSDCVKLHSIELDADGNLVVKIGIRHPFEVGDPLKPITGRNRADLHVFNVEGIVLANTASTGIYPGTGVTTSSIKLVNADGYAGYLDA